jgi:hypothetical protein
MGQAGNRILRPGFPQSQPGFRISRCSIRFSTGVLSRPILGAGQPSGTEMAPRTAIFCSDTWSLTRVCAARFRLVWTTFPPSCYRQPLPTTGPAAAEPFFWLTGGKPMRNLLAFLAAVVLTFLGVGWYLNWYKIKSDPAPAGHHHVNIDVNSEKIVEDVEKGVQKGEQKLQKVLEHEKKSATENVKPPDAGGHEPSKQPPGQ